MVRFSKTQIFTLGVEYGAALLRPRLRNRREGPGPGAPPRPLKLEFPDPDFLLFLMISSKLMSRGSAIFGRRSRGSHTEREKSRVLTKGRETVSNGEEEANFQNRR